MGRDIFCEIALPQAAASAASPETLSLARAAALRNETSREHLSFRKSPFGQDLAAALGNLRVVTDQSGPSRLTLSTDPGR